MITYIIKSGLCSLLLLLVYRLILQREKMYRFNRLYLLFSIVFSLLIPLFTFEVTTQTAGIWEEVNLPGGLEMVVHPAEAAVTGTTPAIAATSAWSTTFIISGLYAAISLIFLCRFMLNLYRIRKATTRDQSTDYEGAQLILLEKTIPAHSFLRYIFMSKADFNDPHTREALLTHELSHVRQRHSWDILFLETLQIFCWINPTLHFYKKAVQLNHELLADESVIHAHGNVRSYQHLLLDKIQQQTITPLTSSFNYFITKKRLAMMTKQPNNKRIACLQWALLPIFGCAVLLFTGRTYAQTQPTTPTKQPAPNKKLAKTWDAKEPPKVKFTAPGGPSLPPGNGATVEQLEKLNTIFKSTTVDSKGRKYHFTNEDAKWVKPIYQAMTLEQRSQYPDIHFMKSPVRKSPTAAQLQEWTNSAKYGIWVDEKRIDNQELANYKAEEFALFFSSRLAKNAVNYGKHYIQVNLNTNAWYDKNYAGVSDLMVVVEKISYTPAPKSN